MLARWMIYFRSWQHSEWFATHAPQIPPQPPVLKLSVIRSWKYFRKRIWCRFNFSRNCRKEWISVISHFDAVLDKKRSKRPADETAILREWRTDMKRFGRGWHNSWRFVPKRTLRDYAPCFDYEIRILYKELNIMYYSWGKNSLYNLLKIVYGKLGLDY